MVLIGHSYGARVAAGYLAAHPTRVSRAVFSSPAGLDPRDTSGANATANLEPGQLAALYGRLLLPRNLLVYRPLQVNLEVDKTVAKYLPPPPPNGPAPPDPYGNGMNRVSGLRARPCLDAPRRKFACTLVKWQIT